MSGILKYGWHFLLIAVAGEMIVPFILAAFYKGYNHTNMVISSLGNPKSPVRIPFNIWMLTAEILFLLAIASIYNSYAPVSKPLTVICVIFVGIFAVGSCIFSCFFSVNETKEVVTVASKIHGFGSVIGFMLFLFVPMMIAMLSFKNNEKGAGILSLLSFLLALISFVLFIMADKPEFKNTVIAKEGLWQRLNLLFMYLPLAYKAIRVVSIQ